MIRLPLFKYSFAFQAMQSKCFPNFLSCRIKKDGLKVLTTHSKSTFEAVLEINRFPFFPESTGDPCFFACLGLWHYDRIRCAP